MAKIAEIFNDVNTESALYTVETIAFDLCTVSSDASFIKMDIEGAEMKALQGAKETFKRNHPVWAISIYHSYEDMVRIIPYIHGFLSQYDLYIRRHIDYLLGAVLYTIYRNRKEESLMILCGTW